MDEERTWDLSILVEDSSLKGVTQTANSVLLELKKALDSLRSDSRQIPAKQLLKHIKRLENAIAKTIAIAFYSYGKYAEDTAAENSQGFASLYYRCYNEFLSVQRMLQRTLGEQVQKRAELLSTPELLNYRHLLHRSIQRLPYTLTQTDEELITEKDSNGISALAQLQESWVGTQEIEAEIEGKRQTLSMSKAFSFLLAEDRETRKNVSKAYFGSFARDRLLHSTALRAVCADHVRMTKRRKLPSYMAQSLIDQDIDEETIGTLLKTLENESGSVQRYNRLKAQYFGYERLPGYDMRAPWSSTTLWKKDWRSVKTSIIRAYDAFDREFGDHVRGLFAERHIDSEDRPGKANAVFCLPFYERRTSFVFVTYSGIMNEAYVLAHELGHAVHSHLMNNSQSALNTDVSICLAETGSIFGELLFTEQLLKECDTDELRIEILAKVLDRFHLMTFDSGLYALFEQRLYDAIEAGEILDADRVCDIWRTTRERIYGDSVEWTENRDYEWANAGQLYMPNFRFYNYSYSFAQLLVFALYDNYRQHPSDFTMRFKRLLSRGSSMSPREQIAEMGYDITRPDFWTLGIKQAEHFLDELRSLV